MKKLISILITAVTLVGCSNNPLKNTQWEGINGCEIQVLSLDVDTCCAYGVSPALGKPFSLGMKYHFNNNILSFSPLRIHFESQPTYKLNGDFLIDTRTGVPSFKKMTK